MSNLWELRIRRLAKGSNVVRCVLIPSEGNSSLKTRIPWEALPGKQLVIGSVGHSFLQQVRRLKLSVDATPGANEQSFGYQSTEEPATQGSLKLTMFEVVDASGSASPFVASNGDYDGLIDALKEETQKAVNGEESRDGDLLPWALAHLYRSHADTLDLAMKDGADKPTRAMVLAATSGLVFDADASAGFELPSGVSFAWGPTGAPAPIELAVNNDAQKEPQDPAVRVLVAEQFAHGLIFRLELSDDETAEAFSGEYRARTRRWVGPSPDGAHDMEIERLLPMLSRLPVDSGQPRAEDALHATDALAPADLLGKQLHYQIEIVNEHNRAVYTGAATLLRERLDAPLPVNAPVMTVRVDPTDYSLSQLELSFDLGGAADDDLAYSSVALFAEDRGLDACGFYADADDLALFAGLTALDLGGPAIPIPEEVAHGPHLQLTEQVALERLKGSRTGSGLKLLATYRLTDHLRVEPAEAKPVKLVIEGKTNLLAVKPPQGVGRRYHVARIRHLRRDPPPQRDQVGWINHPIEHLTTSAMIACRHVLRHGDDAGGAVEVFQVENIARAPAPGRKVFLAATEVGAKVFAPNTPDGSDSYPTGIYLAPRHPELDGEGYIAADHLASGVPLNGPIGGYRVWMRDRMGAADGVPFRPITSIAAVPALVASYRPLPLNGATAWSFVHEADAGVAKPARLDETNIVAQAEKLQKFVKQLLTPSTGGHFRPSTAGLAPLDAPNGQAALAELQDAMARHFEHFSAAADEKSDGSTLPKLADDPRWAGSLYSVLAGARLATTLHMSLDVFSAAMLAGRIRGDGSAEVVKRVRAALASLEEAANFVYWVLADQTDHPFATIVVLCRVLLPAKYAEPAQNVFDAAIVGALTGTAAGTPPSLPIRLLQCGPSDLEIRAFHSDRRFDFNYRRIEDGWRHDLEWAFEVLDRYAHVRSALTPSPEPDEKARPGAFALDEVLSDTDVDELARVRTHVARRAPVRDEVQIARDVKVAQRLVFMHDDPPERRAAAHNALNAARYGEHEICHAFDYTLFQPEAYQQFLKEVAESKDSALVSFADFTPNTPAWTSEDDASKPTSGPEVSARVGRIDLGVMPPYYIYSCESWLVADDVAGKARRATGRVEPWRLTLPKRPSLKIDHELDRTYKLSISVELARLLNTHTERAHAAGDAAADNIGEVLNLGAANNVTRKVPVRLLPDLELIYRFYLDVGSAGSELIPLVSICGNASLLTGKLIERTSQLNGPASPAHLPGFTAAAESYATAVQYDAELKLSLRFDVTVDTAAGGGMNGRGQRLQAVLDHLLDSKDTPKRPRFYFQLQRQGYRSAIDQGDVAHD